MLELQILGGVLLVGAASLALVWPLAPAALLGAHPAMTGEDVEAR